MFASPEPHSRVPGAANPQPKPPVGWLVVYLAALAVQMVPSVLVWLRPQYWVMLFEFDWFIGELFLRRIAPMPQSRGWGVLVHVVLFSIMGWATWRFASWMQRHPDGVSRRMLGLFTGIVSAGFLVVQPYISCDVFIYIAKGWMDATLDLDPYRVGYGEIPYLRERPMGMNAHPSFGTTLGNYGPLFQSLCRIIADLSGNSPEAALVLFKLTCLAALLGCAWLAARLAREAGADGRLAFFLVACSPLTQFCFVAAAHNDVLALAPTLVAMLALRRGRDAFAGFMLGLGFAVKYLPLLFVPAAVIWIFRRESAAARWSGMMRLTLAFALTAGASFFAYPAAIEVVFGAASAGFAYARNSIYLAFYILSAPPLVGRVLRLGAMAMLAGWLIWRWWRTPAGGPADAANAEGRRLSSAVLAFAMLFLSQMVGEWYFIWLLPLLLAERDSRALRDALLLTCTLMVPAILTALWIFPGVLAQVATLAIIAPVLARAVMRGFRPSPTTA